jgi:hypothetical protein
MIVPLDPPLLIGLVGATGCGKTTLANQLVERRGFVRAHMGQPIKDMLGALGLTSEQLTGPPDVRHRPSDLLGGKSPRYAMETLGTDWGRRMISSKIWANAVEMRVRQMWSEGRVPVVIDDLRFPSDWAVVGRLGGTLVRVVRPGLGKPRSTADRLAHRLPALRPALAALGFPTVHETEYHWYDAPADIELENGSTPEALENELIDALLDRGISASSLSRDSPAAQPI